MNEDYDLDKAIEEDSFLFLSQKALLTLENLVKNKMIDIPVNQQVLVDIGIGALTESQTNSEVDILEVFEDHREFILDTLFFDQGGQYTLNDVLAQVVCFRLVNIMEEFLDHLGVEYISNFEK